MTGALLALALVLAPALPLAFSYPAGLERVRDWWLRAVTLGAILVVPPFLAPIAAWWAWRWPVQAVPWRCLPSLVVWVGIGLAWALLQHLPASLWPWVAWGWVSWAAVQSAVLAYKATRQGWAGWVTRQAGLNFGTPVMLAQFLALTAPFWPGWAWPLLAVGLYLTCSWAAFLALGMGALVYVVPWR